MPDHLKTTSFTNCILD